MGLGDDVLAVGRAARMHALSGRKVVIGPPGARYWSAAFEHVPYLVKPDESEGDAERLYDYPGHRPYIWYQRSTADRQVLIPGHVAQPGALHFSELENQNAQRWLADNLVDPGFVLIAPHIKATFSGLNKGWPGDYWCDLAHGLNMRDIWTVLAAPPGSECSLDAWRYTQDIQHEDVRRALAIMRYARCVITTDGLFHHAAAALGVPAIVLWGARTDPRILGYTDHRNLTSGSDWCGSMKATCDHCTKAMAAITPERVIGETEDLLCSLTE